MILHHEVVDPFQTVLKDCSIVGGLTALHTLKINIIKAEERSHSTVDLKCCSMKCMSKVLI